jgi:GH24 family phage-related lysozyme (muramidase)
MSKRIRVNTEGLKKYAQLINQLAAEFGKTGAEVFGNTHSLNDYGGQLPTKREAVNAQHEANGIRNGMQEDAEKILILAENFKRVDEQTIAEFVLPPPPPLDFTDFKHIGPNDFKITSQCGISFIAFHEDVTKDFYGLILDPAGNCQVGIGHLVRKGPCLAEDRAKWGDGLTREKALELLAEDVKVAEEIVKKAVTVGLTQAQFDALVSLAFNLGEIKEDVLDAVNAKDFEKAGELMQAYIEGTDGKVYGGLIKRRDHERDLMLTGMYGNECDNAGDFFRRNDEIIK